MKIEFPVILEGSHSTGKSTLLAPLAEALGVPAVPEAARSILERRQLRAADLPSLPIETLIDFQGEILKAQVDQFRPGNRGVYDRGIVSTYAHCLELMGRHPAAAEFLSYCRECVRLMARREGLTIYVPPSIPLVKDDVRDGSEFHREHLHLLLRSVLAEYEFGFLTLRSRTVPGRVEEIVDYLRSFQRWRDRIASKVA